MTYLKEFITKAEHYCSYQERCHFEVEKKLRSFLLKPVEIDEIIVHLINNNFLNEERFSQVFSQSKFHQKKWGKERIRQELKQRNISDYLIKKALEQIPDEEYETTFETLAEKHWNTLKESNPLKKRKKFCDFLLRKGYDSELVYRKAKEFEKQEKLFLIVVKSNYN